MAKLGFGKYANTDLTEVPDHYLGWLIKNSRERLMLYEAEHTRRQMVEEASASWVQMIIKAGFNELAKRHHPDNGGKNSDMIEVNAAHEKLKAAIQ